MHVRFFGVRGSCPCAGPAYRQVGGNTSCVLVTVDGEPPLVLDLGTGLRALGASLRAEGRAEKVNALVTHLHLDHILGLPFFSPLHEDGARLTLYGPNQDGELLRTALERAIRPPFFPVKLGEIGGEVDVRELRADAGAGSSATIQLGSVTVRAIRVAHPGNTLGFRIDAGGRSLVYLPDHQAPPDRSTVPGAVRSLCEGADVLLHDAQYSDEEYDAKAGWGHSTAGYAVQVAVRSGVRRLFLFHHDPSHSDHDLSALLRSARRLPDARELEEVDLAREGTTVEV